MRKDDMVVNVGDNRYYINARNKMGKQATFEPYVVNQFRQVVALLCHQKDFDSPRGAKNAAREEITNNYALYIKKSAGIGE